MLAAGVLGYGAPEIFADRLRLTRSVYLIFYVFPAGVFLEAYRRWAKIPLGELFRPRSRRALVGVVLMSAISVWNIVGQPRSPTPQGWTLAFDLLWLGIAYGIIDGAFVSVLPVVAVSRAMRAPGWTGARRRVRPAFLGVLASALVSAAYHLGYPDIAGAGVLGPVFGTTLFTLSYVWTENAMVPVVSHVVMHLTAVLFAIDTTVSLPPHQ